MLSITSRWKKTLPIPAARISIGSWNSGVLYADERGLVSQLDSDGNPIWQKAADDSIRGVAMLGSGKGCLILTVRELARYSAGGKQLWRIAPPPFPIELAVRSDGTALAVSADQGQVRTFLGTGKPAWSRQLVHPADFLTYLEGSSELLVVSKRGDATLLGASGEPIWKIALGCEAGRPAMSPQRVAIPSFDGVYSFAPDGNALGVYDVGAPTVRAAFGQGGKLLLVQDARRRLLLVDAATGDTRWSLPLEGDPRDVAFAPDGSAILVANWAGELEQLDVADVEAGPPAAKAKSDGGYLELGSGTAKTQLPGMGVAPSARWRCPVSVAGDADLLVLPAGAGVVLVDQEGQTIALYKGEPIPIWSGSHLGEPAILAGSDSGNLIATGSVRGLRIFDLERGEIANAPVAVRLLHIAGGGSAILAGAENGRLHLFDGRGRPVWDVPTPGFNSASISPDGNLIALVRGGTIAVQLRGGKGGFKKGLAPEGSPHDVALQSMALDDGVVFAARGGQVGILALDGEPRFEGQLPAGSIARRLHRIGSEFLVETSTGAFQLDVAGRRLSPLAGGKGARTHSAYASFVDRLLEFRYDSKEIACLEAVGGAFLWRRAVASLPQAFSVSSDGASLAGIVAGELVLYDLVPAAPAPAESPPTETPPSFLEL